MEKNVKIVKKSNNFIWIEVNRKYVDNLENNFLICGTYIHDVTSTYYNDNIFDEMEADILKFGKAGTPIMFMGDLNARTGNLNDNYDEYGNVDLTIPISNPFSGIPNRKNCDSVINSHGEKVIKFCKT